MSRLFYAAVLVALSGPALATPVQCPPALSVAQTAQAVPPGMRAFEVDPKHGWINAQLSEGSPDKLGWLAPDSTRKDKTGFTNVWTLSPSPDGNWLSCVYLDTSIILSSRLPDKTTHCEIRYRTDVAPPMAAAIDCR